VAATGGQGLIFVPEFAVRTQVENGQLRRVLPGWEGPRQWFSFVRAHRTSIPARVRLLGDFLSGLWATPPWSSG
jgi:DNA-binding transcriptional LysR family regulator